MALEVLEVRAHRALLPQSLRSWPSSTSSRITACMEVVLTYPSQKLVKTEVAATVVLAVLVQGDHHRDHRCNRGIGVMGSWRCWRSRR